MDTNPPPTTQLPMTQQPSQTQPMTAKGPNRLRGGGAAKDCFLGALGCFLCFECCEGCCDCLADIICCPCEMCC